MICNGNWLTSINLLYDNTFHIFIYQRLVIDCSLITDDTGEQFLRTIKALKGKFEPTKTCNNSYNFDICHAYFDAAHCFQSNVHRVYHAYMVTHYVLLMASDVRRVSQHWIGECLGTLQVLVLWNFGPLVANLFWSQCFNQMQIIFYQGPAANPADWFCIALLMRTQILLPNTEPFQIYLHRFF